MFNQSCAASMTGPQPPSAAQISCFACGNIKVPFPLNDGSWQSFGAEPQIPSAPSGSRAAASAPGRLANPADRRPRLAAMADRARAGAQRCLGRRTRRRTGIEPAGDAERRPPVLKTGGATRHPDASGANVTRAWAAPAIVPFVRSPLTAIWPAASSLRRGIGQQHLALPRSGAPML